VNEHATDLMHQLSTLVLALRASDLERAQRAPGYGLPCPGCGHLSFLPVSLCESTYGCAVCEETWSVESEAHYQAWRAAGGEQRIATDRAHDERRLGR